MRNGNNLGPVYVDVLTNAKPLNHLVIDTVTGMVARSTASAAATYAWVGGPVADTYFIPFGTGDDVRFTADGTNLVVSQGAGLGTTLFYDNAFALADPAAPTQRARFDCGEITAGNTRVLTPPNMDINMGGKFSVSLADSTTLTSLAAPTAFDVTATIAQNTLVAGSVVRITAICRSIGVNAGDLLSYTLRVGGVNMVVSTPINVGANNTVILQGIMVIRAGLGAAVQVSRQFTTHDASSGVYTCGPAGVIATVDTTNNIIIDCLATHSANNAGNQSVLESLVVEVC